MTDRLEVDMIINAITEGFKNADKSIDMLGDSYSDLALKNQLATDKAALFNKEIKGLAIGVKKGEISMEDASHAADKLARELGQGAQVTKESSFRWTEIASKISIAKQAFDTVARGAQIAYEQIERGAELELARSQFDNLAASIDTTSDSMLNKLGAATGGMMSNAEQISSASQIISLGLADNEDDVVRLAKSVSTLGLDMQQVILTFANNSKARLDALGLSVQDVDRKTQELKANGFVGDAFDEAVLIALEEKMVLLGDAALTTAGEMKILKSEWQDLKDAIAITMAETAGGEDGIVHLAAVTVKAQDVMKKAVELGIMTNAEYKKSLWFDEAEEMERRAEELQKRFDELGFSTVTGALAMQNMQHSAGLTSEQIADLVTEVEEVERVFGSSVAPASELGERMGMVSERAGNIVGVGLPQWIKDANAANKELFDSTSELLTPMQEINEAIREQNAAVSQAEQIVTYSDNIATMGDDADIAALKVDNLALKLLGLPPSTELTVEADTSAAEKKIKRLADMLGSLGAARAVAPDLDGYGGKRRGTATTGSQGKRYPDQEYATGTNGFIDIPGPVGQPYPITVHGGEKMSVIPAGQSEQSQQSQTTVQQNFYGGNPSPALMKTYAESAFSMPRG